MPGIDTQVSAIVTSHDLPKHQGLDTENAKAHQDYLEGQRGAAALSLNGISTRTDLQNLVKTMDERIKTLRDAIRTETASDRKVAMDRTLVALQALRDQIVQREAAVTTVTDRTGDTIASSYNRVDNFTRTNLAAESTGGQVLRGGFLASAAYTGYRFFRWVAKKLFP